MLYYLPWALLIVASVWVSVAGFLWAFRNGQFSEQDRARYLPLRDEPLPVAAKNPAKFTREVYALFGILLAGGVILLAVLFIGLAPAGGG